MNNIKESLENKEKKYESVFQEYKRHFSVKNKIKNNFNTIDDGWINLQAVLKKIYKIEKDDIFFQGAKFKTNKNVFKVERFLESDKRKEIAFETMAIDKSKKTEEVWNKFTTGFVVKKSLLTKGIIIKYTEHVYAYEELFGFKQTLAKFGFKRAVKKNKVLFEKELNNTFNSKNK